MGTSTNSLNVLDRRPIELGMLSGLKAHRVEIRAGSIFLQGLLLPNPSESPQFFAPVRAYVCLHESVLAIDPLYLDALQRPASVR